MKASVLFSLSLILLIFSGLIGVCWLSGHSHANVHGDLLFFIGFCSICVAMLLFLKADQLHKENNMEL